MKVIHSDKEKNKEQEFMKQARDYAYNKYPLPYGHLDEDVKTDHQKMIDSLWITARGAFLAGVKYKQNKDE